MTKTKKRLAIIISAVIIVLIAGGVGMFAYASDVAKKNSIGLDSALNIAMIDAGAAEDNTTVTKAKMDFEKGVFTYDIEFVVNGVDEYDYTIKASDGTILKKDRDTADSKVVVTAENQTTLPAETTQQAIKETTTADTEATKTTASVASSDITLEKAKTIAFNNAGVSKNDAQIISAHKDRDDGITYYEIEFRTSSYKYEYEIDLNGKIISYDKDPVKNSTSAAKKAAKKTTAVSSDSKYIGVDKAKSIALSKAGLSSKNVTFTKAKLEKDDGIYIYEIEFETSSKEYEFEINAVNGSIVSYSSEPLDYD